MTLNPAASIGHPAYDVLDGSVSGFYQDVDEAIVASDVVKGQYRMTVNPAYNAPNPVDSNSYTTIGLTQSGPMVVDLDNSYITTEVYLQMRMTPGIKQCHKQNGNYNRHGLDQVMFVGWKSSVEAIQRYDILVNSTPIYTQSFCGEESFIQYQTLSDLVKHSTPYTYTSYENASKMDSCVCGTYILIKGQTNSAHDAAAQDETSTLNCRIPIKIPIPNFLIMRDIKYLMSWMGKWEMRLFFSPQNLVFLPIRPEVVWKWWKSVIFHPDQPIKTTGTERWVEGAIPGQADADFVKADGVVDDGTAASARDNYPEVRGWLNSATWDISTNNGKRLRGFDKFVQFGDPIPMCTQTGLKNSNSVANIEQGEIVVSLVKMQMYSVEFVAAQFQIRMDVMEMIKQKYLAEKPLTFPVSTIQISRFTGLPTMGQTVPAGESKEFTMVLCQAINNVDTLFILPFRSHFQHTVCYQPWIKGFQLHAGEYGAYPVQPFDTYSTFDSRAQHMRFNSYIQDSLNVSNSALVSFNRDLCYEFNPKLYLTRNIWDGGAVGNGGGTTTVEGGTATTWEMRGFETYRGKYKKYDDSNFFIGLPFSTDEDFQGGLSSPVSNINFKVIGSFKPQETMKFSTPWVAAFLIDGTIMIRPDPGSDAAKVIWSDRTVV